MFAFVKLLAQPAHGTAMMIDKYVVSISHLLKRLPQEVWGGQENACQGFSGEPKPAGPS
jgi:hypothetical protein